MAVYDEVVNVLNKPPSERSIEDLEPLESWFRKKSKQFQSLNSETLIDLIQHCQFKKVEANEVIVHQGDVDDSFYIILRGRVSMLLRAGSELEDLLDSPHLISPSETDRSKLGVVINTLGDGETFGEFALVSDECTHNTSCVTEEATDLVYISKELYKTSFSDLVQTDFQERIRFVEENALFKDWPGKWKQLLAASLVRESRGYEELLVKQGDPASNMHFIISGEVSLTVDPAAHQEQFADFRNKISSVADDSEESSKKRSTFSLMNWLSAKSRVADRLKSAQQTRNNVTERSFSEDLPEYKVQLSPSAVRKKTAVDRRAKRIKLCYMSNGNIVGDTEFLLDVELYHCTATCTQPTVTMSLHRAIFDKMFKKKNPLTFKQMCRSLYNQIPHRFSRIQALHNVPLLKCFILKIHELNGIRNSTGRDVDDTESLPFMDSASNTGSRSSRAKSGISARSFPMSRRGEERLMASKSPLPSLHDPVLSGRYPPTPRSLMGTSGGMDDVILSGSYRNLTMTSGADVVSKPSKHVTSPDNPRHGMFIKLLQISNPMVKRNHLDVDDEEYKYLLQLKRRMAKKIEDLYPNPSISVADLPGSSSTSHRAQTSRRSGRVATARPSVMSTVSGTSKSSPRKTAMKRSSARPRPNSRQKSVFFSLP